MTRLESIPEDIDVKRDKNMVDNINLEIAIATAVVDTAYEKTVGTVVGVSKKVWNQTRINLGLAFKKYLDKSYDKYSRAKTLFYKHESRPIDSFFVIPQLQQDNKYSLISHSFLANKAGDVVNADRHFAIIQGTGGIGKSTLMKYLFLKELNERDLIPIFFELKDINDKQDDYEIIDVFFENLGILGESLTREAIEYALEKGMFLFLLDGYDEMTREKSVSFVKKLNSFCDQYAKNYYILSSRSCSNFIEFQRFAVLDTCEFGQNQAVQLIDKLEWPVDDKSRFIAALKNGLYKKHQSFASNPLLLTMMFLTYRQYAEIPEKLHLFYDLAFNTLLREHDATKEQFVRELRSGLHQDVFKTIFSLFCCLTYGTNELEFSESRLNDLLKRVKEDVAASGMEFECRAYQYDLINAVCMLQRDGLNYRFVHRSFQEFFTAMFLKDQLDDDMKSIGMQIIKNNPTRP